MDFRAFDGTGRAPRDAQISVLRWLKTNWNTSNVFALNLPTGTGKSAILRALQLELGNTVGIVPTNLLMDQYIETYPDMNYFRGMEHYRCGEDELTCQDRNILKMKHAAGCPYVQCKERALSGQNTVFNPISYYYLTKNKDYQPPDVVIVDEAHKLSELLMLLTNCSFRKGYYNYPAIENEVELVAWLEQTLAQLQALEKKRQDKELLKLRSQIDRVGFVLKAFKRNPQDFVFYTKAEKYRGGMDEYLYIAPIRPSPWLIDTILQGTKVILMSATLFQSDLWDLGIKDFKYLDVPSPIPKTQRPVMYLPHHEAMNYKTSEASIAGYIMRILDLYPGRNTVVHLSYGWVERLRKYFPEALFNTPETKVQVLKRFKEKGGLWLAAGCAEGIDLPGDECRLTIIPMMMRANPTDPVTKKQIAKQGGWLGYELHAIKTVIQQAGRGTRGLDDHSITVIGDNSFPRLIAKNSRYIPASFREAIIWRNASIPS